MEPPHLQDEPYVTLAAVVLFTALLFVNTLRWIASQRKAVREGSLRSRLQSEAAALQREAALLNTPATFGQSAKLLRRAAALRKQLDALGGPLGSGWEARVEAVLAPLKALAWCLTVMALWGVTVAHVPAHWCGGVLCRAVATPHRLPVRGDVSALGWLLACDAATAAFARCVWPPPVPAPAAVVGVKGD